LLKGVVYDTKDTLSVYDIESDMQRNITSYSKSGMYQIPLLIHHYELLILAARTWCRPSELWCDVSMAASKREKQRIQAITETGLEWGR